MSRLEMYFLKLSKVEQHEKNESREKKKKKTFILQFPSFGQRLDALKIFDFENAREKFFCTFKVTLSLIPFLLSQCISLCKHTGFPCSQPIFMSRGHRVTLRHGYSFFSTEAQSSYFVNSCLPLHSFQLPGHSQRG